MRLTSRSISRVLTWVGRHFNRARYDAQREIDGFAARLRHAHDLDGVTSDLMEVVRATMQPSAAQMWLRHP